jgi:hypothetical protein
LLNCRIFENVFPMKHLILYFLLLINTILCYSQIIVSPNYGLKSHQTLVINRIELLPERTVLYISIENRVQGGTFCADRNIFIIQSDGARLRLIRADGIPVCPETYKFKTKGEKLDFSLTFPPLKPGTDWFDLVEECTGNCISFYGIILDSELNRKIDEAFALADKGETNKAVSAYSDIIENIDSRNLGIEGALYVDLITLLYKSGDLTSARLWYNRMLNSNASRLDLYIKNLNSRGIKF